MLSNIIFVLQSILILIEYFILYLLKYDTQFRFENAVKQLASINIFYVKAFQAISTNSHLLTKKQIAYLSNYTDNVPFKSNEIDPYFETHINKVAKNLNDKFEINKQGEYLVPSKSGMVSLVYTGTLNGKRVAIKVLRKNIREKIIDALNKIDFVGKIIGHWPYIRAFNINHLISENRDMLIKQTDLIQEVENITKIYKNCLYTDYVIIPKVYNEYTCKDSSFFVMDYLEGRKLDELTEEDKETYCFQLAKFGIKCILYDRVYHGDLHPGNILFLKDEQSVLRLGIIDFGIIGELTREEQNYYYKILTIMSKKDGFIELVEIVLSKLIEPKNMVETLSQEKKDKIISELVTLFNGVFSINSNFDPAILYDINRILRRHNLYLSRSFCKIQLCVAVADSVISKISSNTTYLDNIKKVVGGITMFM